MTYEEAKEELVEVYCKTDSDCPYRKGMDCDTICSYGKAIEALEKVESQQERIEDLEVLVGMQRKRKYYNKFVKEVWQKERGKLSYPDFDEIYKRYFEQQERLDKLPEQIHKYFLKQVYKRANGKKEVPMGLVADILEHNKAVCEIVKAGGKDE